MRRLINKILCVLFFLGAFLSDYFSYAQCPPFTPISINNCITQTTLGSDGGFITGCNGGNHPSSFIAFTAPPGCVQFNFSNIINGGTWQYRIRNADCSSTLSFGCLENVGTGRPFTISGNNNSGTYLLTPGVQYVLQIMSDNQSTFTVCMTGSTSAADNECAGANTLSGTATFFNGGDCVYTGSNDGGSTSDPAPAGFCAVTLENTQWTKFTPIAGATSFTITGSNMNCTGGGCGFQLGIFSGTCGALTSEGCYGDGANCGGNSSAGPTNAAGGKANIAWSNTTSTGFTATFTPTSGSTFTGSEVFYLVMDGNLDAECQYTLTGTNIVGSCTSTVTPTQPTCAISTGSILVTATTGTPGYNVSWSGTASGNPDGNEILSNGGTYSITNLIPGTYNITVTSASGCVSNNIVTITSPPVLNTAGPASSSPSICINTTITPAVTHITTGATGISNSGIGGANGLPTGVSATWSSNTIRISGTPTVAGTFNYLIPLTGGCGTVSATGTITVNPLPPAPTGLACYETATINATTCQWVVTGTQPPRPATACYETATFNTTTCQWVVMGTQPPRPATACYETATFNTTTCQWVVTGTQSPRPATACYETATFNTTTCQWVVTGTQPPQPITACYEKSTFNTTTFQWVVTGTQPQR
ncbi:MAG: hypothetical protein ACK55K_01285, partial [Bacteroidota bacterium]